MNTSTLTGDVYDTPDVSFDGLPSDDAGTSQPPTMAEAGTPSPEPQAQPTPEFVIRTQTGSVYRTIEDASKGIEEKDTYIGRLNSYLQANGIDPKTGQPASAQPQTAPQEQFAYLNNSDKYVQDLQAAHTKGDVKGYLEIQQRLQNEQMYATLSPYMQMVHGFAKTQAVEQVSTKFPKFREFYGSEKFTRTLENTPLLRQAIQNAESHPQGVQQLGELYAMVFRLASAEEVTETVRANPQPNTPQATPRPTAQPSQLTPSAVPNAPGTNWRADADARKQVIADFEARHGLKK